MDAGAFIAWRKRLGLTAIAAARALGSSRNTVDGYENGRHIPRSIALACAAIEAKIEPIDDAGEAIERKPLGRRVNITERKAQALQRCTLDLAGVRCGYPIKVGDTYYSFNRGGRASFPMCSACYMLNYSSGSARFHASS